MNAGQWKLQALSLVADNQPHGGKALSITPEQLHPITTLTMETLGTIERVFKRLDHGQVLLQRMDRTLTQQRVQARAEAVQVGLPLLTRIRRSTHSLTL